MQCAAPYEGEYRVEPKFIVCLAPRRLYYVTTPG